MVGSEGSGSGLEVFLEEGDGVVESARLPVGEGEVVAAGEGVGVVGSEDSGSGCEGFFEEGDGVVESARLPVGVGEVVAAGEGVGVVGSEDLGLGFEGFLEEWDGVVESGRILVGVGEVVAAGEGVGVVGSEDSPRLRHRVLEDLNGAAEVASLCGDRRQRLLDGEHLLCRVVQPGGGQGDVPVCVAGLVELAEAERQVSPLPCRLVDQFWLRGTFEP